MRSIPLIIWITSKACSEADCVGDRRLTKAWRKRLIEWSASEAEALDDLVSDRSAAWMLSASVLHVRPRLFAFVVVLARKLAVEG